MHLWDNPIDISQEQLDQLKIYRQELRDLPNSNGDILLQEPVTILDSAHPKVECN